MANNFKDDYVEIKDYSKNILRNNPRNITCDEVISIAYINLIDSKKDYSFELFKKLILNIILNYYENKTVSLDAPKQLNVKEDCSDYKICSGKCQQMLPKSMYYTHNNIYGKSTEAYECKKCMAKRAMEWKKNNKERFNEIYKNHYKNANIRRKKYRANLELWYVRDTMLRKYKGQQKYTIEQLDNNPQLIIDFRQKLIEKRTKRFNKIIANLKT